MLWNALVFLPDDFPSFRGPFYLTTSSSWRTVFFSWDSALACSRPRQLDRFICHPSMFLADVAAITIERITNQCSSATCAFWAAVVCFTISQFSTTVGLAFS